MAVVSDLPTGRVKGQYIFVSQDSADEGTSPDSILVTGTVRFTCSATPPLIYRSLSVSAVPLVHEATFDSQGFLTPLGQTERFMELLADAEGVNPRGFTWQVSFNLTEAATGRTINIPSFAIKVLPGQTVDLTEVQPASSSGGAPITRGESAYEVAVRNGFRGTEAQWLTSLRGVANILLLPNTSPIPADTPAGTLVIRSAGVVEPVVPDPTPVDPTPVDPTPVTGVPTVVMDSVRTAGSPGGRSITLPKPSTVVGDVLVAAIHNQAPSGTAMVPPAGWTTLVGGTPNTVTRLLTILTHRVTADSPEQWEFPVSGTGRMVGGLFVIKGASATELSAGSSESTASAGQTAVIPGFPVTGPSLAIVAAQAQVTTSNPWPLPSTIDLPGFTRVFEVGDNENNRATVTNSVISVYAGPASGALPASAIRYGQFVSTTGGVAAAVRGA